MPAPVSLEEYLIRYDPECEYVDVNHSWPLERVVGFPDINLPLEQLFENYHYCRGSDSLVRTTQTEPRQ